LEDAGYPVVGDNDGHLSRPHLLEGRRTPQVRFTPEELTALDWAAAEGMHSHVPNAGQRGTKNVPIPPIPPAERRRCLLLRGEGAAPRQPLDPCDPPH
jgi:hypothetical protein